MIEGVDDYLSECNLDCKYDNAGMATFNRGCKSFCVNANEINGTRLVSSLFLS